MRRLARACAFFRETLEDLPATADAMRALVCECSGYEASEADRRRSTFRIASTRTSMIGNSGVRGTLLDSPSASNSSAMASPTQRASDASHDVSFQGSSDRDLFSAFAHSEALHPSATSPINGVRSLRNSTYYNNARGSIVGSSGRSSIAKGSRAPSSSFIANNNDPKNSSSTGSGSQTKPTVDLPVSSTSATIPTNTTTTESTAASTNMSAASEPENIDASFPVAKLIG